MVSIHKSGGVLGIVTDSLLVNNLGPQTTFPVPEGILNHNGNNDVALTLWSLDAAGAKLGGLALVPQAVIKSSYSKPALVESPRWTARRQAY
jgi:hypothetical protein